MISTVQRRLQALIQPLIDSHNAFRSDALRQLDETARYVAEVEKQVGIVHESILFSRWQVTPDVLATRNEAGYWLNSLGLFGDVATEVCIRTDGDEGLFASYSDVQFKAPVRAGDVLEVTTKVVRVGRRSRTIDFTATVVARGRPDVSESAAHTLEEPLVATTATGTVVVP